MAASPITLSAMSPVARVAVPAAAGRDVLDLRVRTISNPNKQAWALAVSLELTDGQNLVVGSVNPYPIDNPGSFTISIPAAARGELAEQGGFLILALQAASGQAVREPLTIECWATWAQLP